MVEDVRQRVEAAMRGASAPIALWPSATKLSRAISVSRTLTLRYLNEMVLDGTVERRPSGDPSLGWMERSASVFRWLESPLPPEPATDRLLCPSCAREAHHDWHRYLHARSPDAERREDDDDARCDACSTRLDGDEDNPR